MERLAGELKELAEASADSGQGAEIAALAQKLYDQISRSNAQQPVSQPTVGAVDVRT